MIATAFCEVCFQPATILRSNWNLNYEERKDKQSNDYIAL